MFLTDNSKLRFKYIFFNNSLQTFCENPNVQVEVLCYFSEKFRIYQISLILFCIEEPIQLMN